VISRYTGLALAFSLLWASGFVAIKVVLRDCPPLLMLSARFLLAGAALLGYARLRGRPMPRGAEWRPIVVLAILVQVLYLGITALTLQHISAGTGAVLASTNPLLLALVAPFLLGERLGLLKSAGLVVSFAGVAAVMASRMSTGDPPLAMGAFQLSVLFMVAGTIAFKRLRVSPDLLVFSGGQFVVAGAILGVPALLTESVRAVRLTPAFVASFLYMVLGMSIGAMLLWFSLLRQGDATRASAYFFLNPVLGLFLGALVLGEPLHGRDFFGSAAVAAGIYLVQRG
jgi:drug/metabolite transporter (DMT)-like permease